MLRTIKKKSRHLEKVKTNPGRLYRILLVKFLTLFNVRNDKVLVGM